MHVLYSQRGTSIILVDKCIPTDTSLTEILDVRAEMNSLDAKTIAVSLVRIAGALEKILEELRKLREQQGPRRPL